MLPLFLALCVTLFFWMTWWYFVARIFQRTDIVDMVWWLSYGVIAAFLLFTSPLDARVLAFLFVILWSVRLVSHIIVRLRKHSEDPRYAEFRISWGANFLWKSYVYIFLLQGLFISVIALPLFFMTGEVTPQFIIGAILWIVWFVCEYVADAQMNSFRRDPNNKWKIIQTGLWRYSRHPNYFGELLMWWSLWIMSVHSLVSLVGIVSPLLLSYIIIFVTGIPMLESALAKREWFESYKKSTSILIPLPPKK